MGGRGASSGVVGSNSTKLNPYAAAYMKKTGGKFSAVDYMNWINNKHAEFQRINKVSRNGTTGKYDLETEKKFIDFINKK